MPDSGVDLPAINRGSVTAPAGCGKTHLIAEALARHCGSKPILVLTHTNAGVVALRARLDDAGVPAKAYRLSTIDGWAMRLISTFPVRSAHNPDLLQLANPGIDYPNIRVAAAKLLKAGHVNDILAASYARLIVDVSGLLDQAARLGGVRCADTADLRTRRSHAGNLRLRRRRSGETG